jgi:dTDP-4-amino-4,6-dideoxygalactose transaminase
VQAAVLSEKLKIFPEEIEARNVVARRYSQALGDVAIVPKVSEGLTSVWAQYTLRLAPGRRDQFAATLEAKGIPTAVYYPIPLHKQGAYKHYPASRSGLAVSERLAEEVISLPMHAYLDEATQARIIKAVRAALA